ncbi:hypothetical protein [Brevundimonas sp. DWR2-3-1b1]|uniref:hypothetical protein n=1 Tax=unclassified Brevundimonas TaxID=2622653 RepID=UPI003CF30514
MTGPTPAVSLVAWDDFSDRLPVRMTRRQWQALRPQPIPYLKLGSRRLYSAAAVDAWIKQAEALTPGLSEVAQ